MSESGYRAVLRAHGPAIQPALQALGTSTDQRAVLTVIRDGAVAFLTDLDAHPAPPRFAGADGELRLALNMLANAAADALVRFDHSDWRDDFRPRLREATAHLEAVNALMP